MKNMYVMFRPPSVKLTLGFSILKVKNRSEKYRKLRTKGQRATKMS